MNILVTGGLGFIGHHLVNELRADGNKVFIIDNESSLSPNWNEIVSDVDIFRKDIIDIFDLLSLKIDRIVHLAGDVRVAAAERDPSSAFRNNIVGMKNVVEFARAKGARLIFASSSAVYGDSPLETHENMIVSPTNFYGMTKVIGERMMGELDDAVSLRFYCVVGTGENEKRTEHVFPHIFRAIKSGKKFVINGNDWSTRDGTPERDYVHVDDVVSAIRRTLVIGRFNGHEVFNIGCGYTKTVKEIVHLVSDYTSKEIEVDFGPRRHGDSGCLKTDISKAVKELKWNPAIDITEIVQDVADYYLGEQSRMDRQ